MREKNVKKIVQYYYEIPEMVRLLKTEKREQESLYDTLKGTGGDGMQRWRRTGKAHRGRRGAFGRTGRV